MQEKQTKEMAILGVLCVALVGFIGRGVLQLGGGNSSSPAPAPPSNATPAPAGSPSTAPAAAAASAPLHAQAAAVSAPGPATPTALAAVDAAKQTVATVNTQSTGGGALTAPTPGPGSPPVPGSAAAIVAAVAARQQDIYFPLPPDELRNPFMPAQDILAAISAQTHPPAPPANKPAPAASRLAAPAPGTLSPRRPPVPASTPLATVVSLPPATGRSAFGSGAGGPSTGLASLPSGKPGISPLRAKLDAIQSAQESLKTKVGLKGVLLGNPSTALVSVDGSELTLHPGDAIPIGSDTGVRFVVVGVGSDSFTLRIDPEYARSTAGQNRPVLNQLLSERIHIYQ